MGNTLSISRGIVGARPGLFIDLEMGGVGPFVEALGSVSNARSWGEFVTKYQTGDDAIHVIDRRDPVFWTFFDEVHAQWFADDPVNAAVLDVSEYLWPQQL